MEGFELAGKKPRYPEEGWDSTIVWFRRRLAWWERVVGLASLLQHYLRGVGGESEAWHVRGVYSYEYEGCPVKMLAAAEGSVVVDSSCKCLWYDGSKSQSGCSQDA